MHFESCIFKCILVRWRIRIKFSIVSSFWSNEEKLSYKYRILTFFILNEPFIVLLTRWDWVYNTLQYHTISIKTFVFTCTYILKLLMYKNYNYYTIQLLFYSVHHLWLSSNFIHFISHFCNALCNTNFLQLRFKKDKHSI